MIKNPTKTYQTLISAIKKMYLQAKLVHCDLSPFNILYHQRKPYLIDLGQAVLLDHPNAHEFLKRDLHNLSTFFKKYQIDSNSKQIYEKLTKREW